MAREGQSADFVWKDGTEWDYDNWREGEPNNWNGNEDCAMIVMG